MAQPYVGEIRMFAGNFAPAGWMFCEGQLLPISENDALFTLIGTTYGGDGQTTFALPDLRGRLPLHQGSNGSSSYSLAQNGGTETVTLTTSQLPAHAHTVNGSSAATTGDPAGAVPAAGSVKQFSTQAPDQTLNPAQVTSSGGQPHDNMPPFLGPNFIISLFG